MQPETYLVQLQAGLKQRASASTSGLYSATAGSEIAAYIRGQLADLLNAANAIKTGFQAVRIAVPMFSNGNIIDGLGTLTSGVMDAVMLLLPSNLTESEAFLNFQQILGNVQDMRPDLVATVTGGINAYKEGGDISVLLQACRSVFEQFGPLLMQFLPSGATVELARYFGAVEDALEAVEDGLEALAEGNTSEAILQVYSGLKTALTELVPDQWHSSEEFAKAVDILDISVGSLTGVVLQVQQQLLQSSACWKGYLDRERSRPTQCPANHWFDGLHWCFPKGSSPPSQIKNVNGFCMTSRSGWVRIGTVQMSTCDRTSSQQQWFLDNTTGHIKNIKGHCLAAASTRAEGSRVRLRACREGKPEQQWVSSKEEGSIKLKAGVCLYAANYARQGGSLETYPCDSASKHQQWTMSSAEPTSLLDASVTWKKPAKASIASCDKRSAFNEQRGPWCYKACPAGTDAKGTRCRTKCTGDFPADAALLCGKSYKKLGLAIQDVTARVLKTGNFMAKKFWGSLGEPGSLTHTIDSLTELGLGFMHPTCPRSA